MKRPTLLRAIALIMTSALFPARAIAARGESARSIVIALGPNAPFSFDPLTLLDFSNNREEEFANAHILAELFMGPSAEGGVGTSVSDYWSGWTRGVLAAMFLTEYRAGGNLLAVLMKLFEPPFHFTGAMNPEVDPRVRLLLEDLQDLSEGVSESIRASVNQTLRPLNYMPLLSTLLPGADLGTLVKTDLVVSLDNASLGGRDPEIARQVVRVTVGSLRVAAALSTRKRVDDLTDFA